MDLKVFKGQDKSELSMIEVAHAILAQHGDAMAFVDLANEVQQYLGKSDEEIRERLSQFYTDLNVDGSFISLGDNTWGLRAWYPFESINEATIHEDEEDQPKRKKRKKVNAFLVDAGDDDDVIDYDDDDPEDQDLTGDEDDDDSFDKDDDFDDSDDTENPDVEDDVPEDGIEGQLAELADDEDFGTNDDDEDDDEDDN
ncbi:DNA-directed RNA polymerase subunit delta [Paucilactobacillus wasatchensis]|uniref:Probable DNA-directed RNA polymerase subunit delta n=1 Tax=Paucilactobacillus wasatchensis TaxID=1335616 RepID=A0A0D1A918_9LACO|nr:DNA-directed RNA polymerase subunit delta [Paucilactobacillus wasatchensis]KIS04167.1 DNA-directed RNA polymerase delta subunit [Paucilactobacillus wasatchensis]